MIKNFLQYFIEQVNTGKQVVIFPGRFQPGHKGHAELYRSLVQEFPNADVYIASSAKVDEKSPLTFEERKSILQKLGIPGDKIVNVKSTYKATEITDKYDSATDSVIFALSEKDSDRIAYTKKDGTPGYFKKLDSNNEQTLPINDKGYIKVASVNPFKVLGKDITSATQVRDMYRASSPEERKQIIVDLYGKYDIEIYNLLNDKLK
jgi:hypothetical protein